MAFSYTCLTLQRCVIPILLVLTLFRPVGISFVYLIMYFVSPFVPVATTANFKGSVTAYFSILITLSTILLFCHSGLQIAILLLHNDLFEKCSFTEQIVRHIGFVNFHNLNPLAIIEWLAPEAIIFIASMTIFWVMKKLTSKPNEAELENGRTSVTITNNVQTETQIEEEHYEPNFSALIKLSPIICLVALFFAAVLRPSAPGGLYFIIFLLSASYMATYQKLQRGFVILLRLLMLVMILHIFCIVAYQTPYIQQHIDKQSLLARLLGLEPLITSDCTKDIRILVYNTDYKADSFLSPVAMLIAYYVFALTSKNLLHPLFTDIVANAADLRQQIENGSKQTINRQISLMTHTLATTTTRVHKRSSWTRAHRLNVPKRREQRSMVSDATETTPLVRQNKQIQREAGVGVAKIEGDIPMNTVNAENIETVSHKNSLCDQLCYGFISVGGFIYENSYIFTNILMMAWSIVYHSWLTFVLLLWGNVLWMLENQRHAMMRSTPFIVIYAELLLLAQYIYGMDLTNDELPTKVDITGINLEQIGFIRPQENGVQPCMPLIVKTAFLLMFWVTLRQFIKEKLTQKRTKYARSIFSPLRATIDDADGKQETKRTSRVLKKFGSVIKNLLVRLWIWLVILVILLCALTGHHMTGFRICYMALFLFFLLVFQSSAQVWVKVMYGFWIFLIFYAMSILILIYTYQFDEFDKYWTQYLNISKTLQQDIGLERYETKDLFLHLLSPTIIVILTAIQVHYFHKRFIASLIKTNVERHAPEAIHGGSSRSHSNYASHAVGDEIQFSTVTDLVRMGYKKLTNKVKSFMQSSKHFVWRLLEFHFIKVVYISAFVCCINQICFLHLPFLFLCVIGTLVQKRIKILISFTIAFIATIIIITKMIYQVAYLEHEKYNVQCPSSNITENDASWFGLKKAPEDGGLIGLLRYYIIYMIITTVYAIIRLRQSQLREKFPVNAEFDDKVMFPEIVRSDAEKNIKGLLKYLCNYGYYKFGIEACLIWLVSTITYRQDIMSSLYAIWLIIFIYLTRDQCERIWNVFQLFIAIAILVQYIVLLNLPPSFCLEYPWQNSLFSASFQGWALLPGYLHYDHSKKLMFDFILLILVNRQRKVFLIEKNIDVESSYAGGSNKSVVADLRNLGQEPFENPTRDFLSSVRNYLDILKNIVLCGLFWVTLAVIFLAGTNIGDLLGLGYLISAMIFLWSGSDFYLKPINVILRYWKLLIYYNVANIVFKTFMQLAGCIFMKVLTENCCWLVHLLSISCASAVVPIKLEDADANIDICPAVDTRVVLVWDAICFALLICQLRIFKSHYFCHIILDARANSLLASRGAVLIEELRQKQIIYRQEHENEVLVKIKRKMEKIRATQQKMLRPLEKPTHFDEFGYMIPGKTPKRKQIKNHPNAVRAGDYYMFEEVDEKFQLDVIDDTVDYLDTHEKITESDKKMTRRKTAIDEKSLKFSKSRVESQSDIKAEEESEEKINEEPSTSQEVSEKQKKKDELDEVGKSDDEDNIESNPIVRLLEGFLVALTIRLNRYSRSYRYVNRVLSSEKKELRQQTHMMGRLGKTGAAAMFSTLRNSVELHSAPENHLHEDISKDTTDLPRSRTELSASNSIIIVENMKAIEMGPEIRLKVPSIQSREGSGTLSKQWSLSRGDSVSDLQMDDQDFTSREHNIVIEVLIALYYVLLANTDVLCYIVVFIYQVNNASVISLPLPIMVFLWGTLSLPRPTKTFWVTLIAYTQAIVVLKCIFQFKLIWAKYINFPNQPLTPEKVFGVEANPNYAIVDIILLITLFFHRFMLKSQGLWKSEYRDELIVGPEGSSSQAERAGEDDYKTQSATQSRHVQINKDTESITSYHDHIKSLKRKAYKESLGQFFTNLVKKTRMPTDVYALMFLCDFVNFLVLLFNFSAFASQQVEGESGGVQTYLAENKVPIPFLIMLLAQFLLIVIDRALYLRKALVPKIVFHFFSVIFIHIWMFFIVPAVTERSFYMLKAPIVFYIIKCCYLLLSSYQIKCGYPKRVLGNFLCKGFSLPNMLSFKVYTLIPFLYELRTILDWVCVDTTMTLFDWLKMEDIFTEIYFIKCSRQLETDFPSMRATKKPLSSKLLLGGGIVFLIVIAIWGPLCLFALTSAVGQANVPFEVGVTVRIGPYDPIYSSINRESIETFNDAMFQEMKNVYMKEKQAMTFLSGYDAEDVAAVNLPGNSPSMWSISPPDKQRLFDDLENHRPLTARFSYTLTRVNPDKDTSGVVSGEVVTVLNSTFEGIDTLKKMLDGKATADERVVIPSFIPKFLKVLNKGELSVVSALLPKQTEYRSLAMKPHFSETTNEIWWEIGDVCEIDDGPKNLKMIPLFNCDSGIVMYTFNDKKFPSTFSFITKGGIIGLYTTLVLLFSRVLKSFITGKNRRIMFEDLPYVDRVLQLCLDIYLVREALEFTLEEDLFAKLIFLYRSPETMIKWTRPQEETQEEEAETESVRSRPPTERINN